MRRKTARAFHHHAVEELRTLRTSFDARLAEIAANPELRKPLERTCRGWKWPKGQAEANRQLVTRDGRRLLSRVGDILEGARLPRELSVWAVAVGVTGRSDSQHADSYFSARIACHSRIEVDPVLGGMQLVLRVPHSWSVNRIAWFAGLPNGWLIDQLLQSARPRPGRPSMSVAVALELAQDFDATQTGTPRMSRKEWLARLQTWLGSRARAATVWRLIRSEIGSGAVSLSSLEYSRRRRTPTS